MRPSPARAAVLATAAVTAVVLAACHGGAPAAAPAPVAPGAGASAASLSAPVGASASASATATASVAAPARVPASVPAGDTGAAGRPASTAELDALMRARNDSALHRFTPADVQFMTTMIGHHTQAITMSRMAATHGARESVRTLAARIINAQRDEIATMQQWLRERGQPVPDPAAHAATDHAAMDHDMAGMSDMPGMAADHATMPGMLTAAQMAALDRARGAEFDRLFLTGMIQHHRGATSMVQTLFGSYGAGQDEAVFKFASDVNVDQTTEIARMERMLAAVLFAPDSAAK